MKHLILLFLLFSFCSTYFSQESRIALVIGNSNYENGSTLKNPVNDALLMKQTFEKLGFDVILDTNIEYKSSFYNTIKNYKKQRKNYDVGFVYYAGHGVQIGGINYLLATKETYEEEADVRNNGMSIEELIDDFNDPIENQINILILDACRNNPFEKNWLSSSRAIENQSLGLAEVKKQSTGSLIAFSTSANQTAKDGDSNNSFYCASLAKNMQIEGLNIRSVFGKVCKEVKAETGQYPAVYDQLMDYDFYLKKTDYTDKIEEIDSLIDVEDFFQAGDLAISILTLDSNNVDALLRKALIDCNNLGNQYDLSLLNKALKLAPNNPEIYHYMSRCNRILADYPEAIENINKAIQLDSLEAIYFHFRGNLNVETDSLNEALKDYSKAIELDLKNIDFLQSRAILYDEHLNKNDKALDDYKEIIKIDPNNVNAINDIGNIYLEENKIDEAIEFYENGIKQEEINPLAAAYCYGNRAAIYAENNDFEKAISFLNKAITIDSDNADHYYNRALFYRDYYENNQKALEDFNIAIDMDPENVDYLNMRALLYYYYLNNNDRALDDYKEILKIDPNNIDAINDIGLIYQEENKIDKAIEFYENGIKQVEINPLSAAYCYSNRADLYARNNDFENAILFYNKAVSLDLENGDHYYNRGLFYRDYYENNQKALEDFNNAINVDPENVDYLYERAILYNEYLNNNDRALEDYEKILKIDPSNVVAINDIGTIYEEENKIEKAIEFYENGIKQKETNPRAAAYCYSNRAFMFAENNDIDNAILFYNEAISLDPENGNHYYRRGLFYRDYYENNQKALEDFNSAIEISPEDIYNLYERAILYAYYINNNEKALDDFQRILELNPNDIDAIYGIGTIYQEENNIEDAIEFYENGINQKEINPIAAAYCYSNRADLYARNNELEKAISFLNKAISLDPENADHFSYRALFYRDYMNDTASAIKELTEAIKLNPNSLFYLERSKLYDINGEKKMIEDDLNEAIELSFQDPECYYNRAFFYAANNDFKAAEKDIRRAVELDTNLTNTILIKAKIHILKGETQMALDELEDIINIEPNDPETYFLKGKIYGLLGETEKAIYNFSICSEKLLDGNYYLLDNNRNQMSNGQIYFEIGNFFEQINQKEIMCSFYQKARENLLDDYRFHSQKLLKVIEENIKELCQ